MEVSAATRPMLYQHELAILAETSLSSAQSSMLTTYVSGGGMLLAMRPVAQITGVFALGTSARTLTDGYLKIKMSTVYNGSAPGSGRVSATLQIHGDTVDLFQTAGGGAPWVDRDKRPIPQADEQRRLFARLVQQMIGRLHPVPQLTPR